jgi:hypothetical protein
MKPRVKPEAMPGETPIVYSSPLERLTSEQLDRMLEAALAQNETALLSQIITEVERRGGIISV